MGRLGPDDAAIDAYPRSRTLSLLECDPAAQIHEGRGFSPRKQTQHSYRHVTAYSHGTSTILDRRAAPKLSDRKEIVVVMIPELWDI